MALITFEGLVGSSDGVTVSFLTQTYPALARAFESPIYYVAILYWAVYWIRLYRGNDPTNGGGALARLLLTFVIFGALNFGGLAGLIYRIFFEFMEGTGSTIMAGQPTAKMIDAIWNNIGRASMILMNVSWMQGGVMLLGFGLFLCNVALFAVALYYIMMARVGLAITMLLLPAFIVFLFFEHTRQWLINWISNMLYFCLIYILVIAIIRFGFLAFGDAIQEIAKEMTLKDAANTTADQVGYLYIIEIVLIGLMLSARHWASQLSGGAAVGGLSAIMLLSGRLPKKGQK